MGKARYADVGLGKQKGKLFADPVSPSLLIQKLKRVYPLKGAQILIYIRNNEEREE